MFFYYNPLNTATVRYHREIYNGGIKKNIGSCCYCNISFPKLQYIFIWNALLIEGKLQ